MAGKNKWQDEELQAVSGGTKGSIDAIPCPKCGEYFTPAECVGNKKSVRDGCFGYKWIYICPHCKYTWDVED